METFDDIPTERLEHEVTSLAGRIAAETCRFLLLLAELDRREAWQSWGARSCAGWLSWRCGISRRAALDHLRVGHALARLPAAVEAFSRGELSYSKVRALVRIATPASDGELVELARTTTAAQLERIVAAALAAERDPAEVARERGVTFGEEEGLGTVRARLLPEQQAVVEAAVAAAVERQPVDERSAERTLANRRADAFAEIFEHYLSSHRPTKRPGCQRQTIVLHVDADVVAGTKAAPIEGTGVLLHPDTARRLACDATVLAMFERGDRTIGAGRTTRLIGRKLRRALMRRSGHRCEWPGCDEERYLDGHHVWHWEDGGPTELDNLVHLCWWHHHAVHEGRCRVRLDGTTVSAFLADGTPLEAAPAIVAGSRSPVDVDPAAPVARWAGERLDLGCAVDAIVTRRNQTAVG